MKKSELGRLRLLAGLKGCEIECIDADGVVRWSVGYLAGVHYLDPLGPFMVPCDELRIKGAGYALDRQSRVAAQSYGEMAVQSGANPDFCPQRIDEAERRMRNLLHAVNKKEKRLQRQLEHAERLAKASPAPASDLAVIDDGDTVEPATPAPESAAPAAPDDAAQGAAE
jgi:hypothetical protein